MVHMRDVAAAAQVSLATVSRVLSGSRPVDPELAARVRRAADDLGYRTNRLARGLRRQHTDIIGMVVPEVSNPFFATLMQAVSRALQARGRTVLLADAEDDSAKETEHLLRLVDHSVDGIVLVPVDEDASAEITAELQDRTHMVLLDRRIEGLAADMVGVDQVAGIHDVLRHLRATGVRAARMISATLHSSVARERAETFASLTGQEGLTVTGAPLLGTFTADWGRQAVADLIEADALPEALVCGNDLIALGALQSLRQAGVSVPDEVAVTGFDDIGFSGLSWPPLTTVRQPVDELAEAAIDRLEGRMEGHPPGPPIRLRAQLVVRGTTRAEARTEELAGE